MVVCCCLGLRIARYPPLTLCVLLWKDMGALTLCILLWKDMGAKPTLKASCPTELG